MYLLYKLCAVPVTDLKAFDQNYNIENWTTWKEKHKLKVPPKTDWHLNNNIIAIDASQQNR